MLIVFISLGAVLTVLFLMERSYRNRPKWAKDYPRDTFEFVFIPLMIGALTGTVVLGIFTILSIANLLPTHTESTYGSLEAINDNSSVSGSFFLGSGSVNGRMVFSYYQKSGDSYQLLQQDADRSLVKYTDGIPTVEYLKDCSSIPSLESICSSPRFIFYVPRGSIQSNYNLDAK